MKKSVKIQVVKPTSVVSIDISGGFLNALNGVLEHMVSSMPNEESMALYLEIKDSNGDLSSMSEKAKDLFVLTTLINTIDLKFKKSGLVKTETVEFEVENESQIKSMVDKVFVQFEGNKNEDNEINNDDSNPTAKGE